MACVLPSADAQDAAWVEVETPDCPTCGPTNLHFITPTRGWAAARGWSTERLASVPYVMRSDDGGDVWFADEVDDASADTVVAALALSARQLRGRLSDVLGTLS